MQDVVFREYQENDAHAVSQFLRKIFAEMGWTEEPSDHIDEPKDYFYTPGGFLIVGEDKKVIVATAGIIPLTSTDVLLKRFYLEPAYRGQGYAQQLFTYVYDQLKKKNYHTIYLDVNITNPRGIRFYEKLGFEKCDVKPNPIWSESIHPNGHIFYRKSI